MVAAGPVAADDPPQQIHFISMRAPDVDPSPRYVSASAVATDEQTVALAGCDAATYYLAPDDAAAVNAALANANTVQLQSAPQGSAPQDSSVVCLIQASQ